MNNMSRIILMILTAGSAEASTLRDLHEDATLAIESLAHCPTELAELTAQRAHFGLITLAIPRPADSTISQRSMTATTWKGGYAPTFQRYAGPTLTVTETITEQPRSRVDAPSSVTWDCTLSPAN
jgi:hypothetical protein